MTNRKGRVKIAQETLEILDRGEYTSAESNKRSIRDALQHAVDNSALYTPEMFADVFRQRDRMRAEAESYETTFEVVNSTTLEAARIAVEQDRSLDIACLNFASAKNPGGGFLGGSQAQEESLARSSGMYPCINQMQEMYETNRGLHSCLYTDHMIYSPSVPVIRDDNDCLLDEPYNVSILTVPAVNAGAVRRNNPQDTNKIAPTMISRMEKLLSLATVHGHTHLILGAWGCGVFKNDTSDVAQWFYDHLVTNATFRGAFQSIVFAITDWSEEQRYIGPFAERFDRRE